LSPSSHLNMTAKVMTAAIWIIVIMMATMGSGGAKQPWQQHPTQVISHHPKANMEMPKVTNKHANTAFLQVGIFVHKSVHDALVQNLYTP